MLDSLHIQNYRLFKDLKIDKLGQVNLISGKNNCGKTALLEALQILISKGDVVPNILRKRNAYEKNDFDTCRTLFRDFDEKRQIKINNLNLYLENRKDFRLTLKEYFKNGKLKKEYYWASGLLSKNDVLDTEGLILIPFLGEMKYDGWEDLEIEQEEQVNRILQFVEPKVIDFRIGQSGKPVLRLNGFRNRQPIEILGDGANRLFMIAYALVNSKNKILLIDEFEVGLHHSVQKQLWEIIFKYAKEWNIQVFVTTHSLDTVRSFSEVSDKNEGMGEFMRLQKSRMTGEIEAVVYSKKSLDYAIEDSLEMR